MNKDLTPLEALEIIKNAGTIYVGCASNIYTRYSFEIKIIENALTQLEIYEALFSPEKAREQYNKLKALEIIKNKVQKIKWLGFKFKDGANLYSIDYRETPTTEEDDLLREVLK